MSHAADRAKERYGVELTHSDLKFIGEAATTPYHPCAICIGKSDNQPGCFQVAIRLRSRWIGFVVSTRGTVITAIPEHCLQRYRKKLDAQKKALRKMGLEPSRNHNNWASPPKAS